LSARDPFDDQHGAGAGGTNAAGLLFRGDLGHATAAATRGSVRGRFASSVGEEAEVADADQSFGQNVKKKSAQELIC